MKKIWNEFKEFAVKGNAVDLAVGVIVEAAFTGIINSLVKDVIMPPISLLTGGLDFSNKFVILRAASLDEDPGLRPQRRIWRSHDAAWLFEHAEIPSYPEFPPEH